MSVSRELPPADAVQSIGCLMLNGIGDIVCVTPALRALKERYPAARLTMMIRPHLRGLLEGNPDVDAMLCYESGAWRKVAFMRAARAQRFDLWIDLHVPTFNTVSSNARDFLRNAVLMRAAAARYRVGYAVPQLRPFLTHPVPVPETATLAAVNVVDMTLALARPIAGRVYRKQVPVTAADRTWAAHALPGGGAPRIALFFGSRQSADLWPQQRVVEFLDLLAHACADAELVLIGGEHELALAPLVERAFARRRATGLHNFVGKATFGQSAALLERCDALVSTDSGPMHIAEAVEVPTVALFSSKNYPAIWQPRHRETIVLNHPVECGPCFRADCPIGNRCMNLIEPQEVLSALLALLQRRERPRLSAD